MVFTRGAKLEPGAVKSKVRRNTALAAVLGIAAVGVVATPPSTVRTLRAR